MNLETSSHRERPAPLNQKVHWHKDSLAWLPRHNVHWAWVILASAVFGFGFALSQVFCFFCLLKDCRSSVLQTASLCPLQKRGVWCRARGFCARNPRVYAVWGVVCISPVYHSVYGAGRVSLDDISVWGSTSNPMDYSVGFTKARCYRAWSKPLSESPLPPLPRCCEEHSDGLITSTSE